MVFLNLFVIIVLISGANTVYEFGYKNRFNTNLIPRFLKNDPINDMSTPAMIRHQGYPAESHVIETNDGYLLTLHRIPGRKGSKPVFLQHGILGSSADWVIAGEHKGLAFLLADKGYDVWLGNVRGNTYSRAHINLSPKNLKFWDFSWHEIGLQDLPAMLTYIAQLNSGKIIYIGHSMGATTFYVMASQRRDIASMVEVMFGLGPIAYIEHGTSPIFMLAPFSDDLKWILDNLGNGELLSQSWLLTYLFKLSCKTCPCNRKIYGNVMFCISGYNKDQFNETLLPTIINHYPGGASTKTVIHYVQGYKSGKFRPYDYGYRKNMVIYNRPTPPDYKLSKISVPIHLMYGDNDLLSNSTDVKRLYKNLFTQKSIYRVPNPKFGHPDFLWGIDAPKLVYNRIFKIIKKHRIRSHKA